MSKKKPARAKASKIPTASKISARPSGGGLRPNPEDGFRAISHGSMTGQKNKELKDSVIFLTLLIPLIIIAGFGFVIDPKDRYQYFAYAAPCAASIVAGLGMYLKPNGVDWNKVFYLSAVVMLFIGFFSYMSSALRPQSCGWMSNSGGAAFGVLMLIIGVGAVLLYYVLQKWRHLGDDGRFLRKVAYVPLAILALVTVSEIWAAVTKCP